MIGLEGIVGNSSFPDPSTYFPLVLDQQYFAATHDTTLNAWGILMQSWENRCGATSVTHEKN